MNSLHHVPSKKVQLYLVPAGFLFIVVTVFGIPVHAGEVVMHTDTITFAQPSMPSASCNCEGDHQPPWHGSVGNRCCNRPCCPPPTLFHADACVGWWGLSTTFEVEESMARRALSRRVIS